MKCAVDELFKLYLDIESVEIKQPLARVEHQTLLFLGLVNEPLTSDCGGI
jgi:hypothetical protein